MSPPPNAKIRLLAAFPKLIEEKALAALTLDEICTAANAHKGSFYHAFESKNAWAEASLQHLWEKSSSKLDSIFSPTKSAWDRIDGYIDFIQTKSCGAKNISGCPFFCVGIDLTLHEPRFRQMVCKILDHYRNYLESAIREGQRIGSIREEDAASLSQAAFQMIEGAQNQARIQQEGKPLQDLKTHVRWLLYP